MKNTLKLLIFIAVIALVSCQKGDEPTPAQPNTITPPITTPCGNSAGKNNLDHCEQYQEWYDNTNVKFGYNIKAVNIGASDTLVIGQKDSLVNPNVIYAIMNSGKSIVTDSTNHLYHIQFSNNIYQDINDNALNKNLWRDDLPTVSILSMNPTTPYLNVANESYVITNYKLIGKWYDNVDYPTQDIYYYVVHVIFEYDDTIVDKHFKYEIDMIVWKMVNK